LRKNRHKIPLFEGGEVEKHICWGRGTASKKQGGGGDGKGIIEDQGKPKKKKEFQRTVPAYRVGEVENY